MIFNKSLAILFLVAPVIYAASSYDNLSVRPGCSVRVWSGQPRQGGRCLFSDEVMTGIRSIDPMIILCSRLDVQCRDKVTGNEIPVETDRLSETRE